MLRPTRSRRPHTPSPTFNQSHSLPPHCVAIKRMSVGLKNMKQPWEKACEGPSPLSLALFSAGASACVLQRLRGSCCCCRCSAARESCVCDASQDRNHALYEQLQAAKRLERQNAKQIKARKVSLRAILPSDAPFLPSSFPAYFTR